MTTTTTKRRVRRYTCVPNWEWRDYLAALEATEPDTDDVPVSETYGQGYLPACVPDAEWTGYVDQVAHQERIR